MFQSGNISVGSLLALADAESPLLSGGEVSVADHVMAFAVCSFDGSEAASPGFLASRRFRRRCLKLAKAYRGRMDLVRRDAAAFAQRLKDALHGPRVAVEKDRKGGDGVPIGWGLLAVYLAIFGGSRADVLRMPAHDAILQISYYNVLAGRAQLISGGRAKLLDQIAARRAAKKAAEKVA